MEQLRSLYYQAVEDESAIALGLAQVDSLRNAGFAAPGQDRDGVLTAYRGALITLRAKHGFWPPDRLKHLREGLRIMDAAVAAHPEVAEVRYLRLMSCFYLPGILGRGDSVREDFAALAALLPEARGEYPDELYAAIVRFVLTEGNPDEAQRRRLEAALAATG